LALDINNKYSYFNRIIVLCGKKIIFYGQQLLATHPPSKLKHYRLSIGRDWLFNIFTAVPPYLEAVSSILNQRTSNAVVTSDPLNVDYYYLILE
jgi:hypothetical protein